MFWPADLHVIGKDIARFHAVYWPAFLMSAGIAIPDRIFAHGHLFNRGEKMSKSVGNVVDPMSLIETYGADQVRYFFLREVPFGQDGNYSIGAITNRINADLANDLGNLAQRSLTMIARNCNGRVPTPGPFAAEDEALLSSAENLLDACRTAIWSVVGDANRYFAAWDLKKSDPRRMETVLYVTGEILRVAGILIQPVMPQAGARLLELLGVAEDQRDFRRLTSARQLVSGTQLPEPEVVFPRVTMAGE